MLNVRVDDDLETLHMAQSTTTDWWNGSDDLHERLGEGNFKRAQLHCKRSSRGIFLVS